MKHLLRHGKLVMLTMILALVGLTFAAPAMPAAHAASQPSITATGYEQSVGVQGSGFTQGGRVFVAVYDAGYHRLTSTYVTATRATWVCLPITHFCRNLAPGGAINAYMDFGYFGYVHVIARDLSTNTWSNWSTTHVALIP